MRIIKINKNIIDNINILINGLNENLFRELNYLNDNSEIYQKINTISKESIINYILSNFVIESYKRIVFDYYDYSDIYCKVNFYGHCYKKFFITTSDNDSYNYIQLSDIIKYVRDTKLNNLLNE